jgi:undecaprenyl pyrophosphate phosphatase UppP
MTIRNKIGMEKDGVLTGMLQGISTLPKISRSNTSTTYTIWWRVLWHGSDSRYGHVIGIDVGKRV